MEQTSHLLDRNAAVSLTNSLAPVEMVADQVARSAGIIARSDTSAASTAYVEVDGQNFPFEPDCRQVTRCTFTNSSREFSFLLDFSEGLDLELFEKKQTVLTKNGITLLEARGTTFWDSLEDIGGPHFGMYGAWTRHAAFGVLVGAEGEINRRTNFTLRGAFAYGDSTGSNPSARAQWRGLMVGTPARGSSRDHLLQGDATLIYDSGKLSAEFTNIVNLDRGVIHIVPSVRFDEIPVNANGTYDAGGVGNKIQGAFVGPNHQETGGTFEQRGVIGAFGAKRQATN